MSEALRLPLGRLDAPASGHIHVWMVRIPEFELPGMAAPAGRRQRILETRIRQKFLLRLLLGAYLGRPGRDVRLAPGDNGKPRLAGGPDFNLSHSGDWLAVAVAAAGAGLVGIDVEQQRILRRPRALAKRYFLPGEAAMLEGLEEPALSAAFLRLWTAKEAVIKAAGQTVAGHLSRVRLGHRNGLFLEELPDGWPDLAGWSLSELRQIPDLKAHLAVAGPVESVTCRRLLPALRQETLDT